ncbi:hypothetical protein Aduo_015457 [Ancylostoma duodenale]
MNAALLKCGRECPAEQIRELEARTEASSFFCADKIEEFRLVSGCLAGAEDVMSKCAAKCEVTTEVPLRFDSSPAASVNPTVFLDGAGGTCKKHICMVKCSQEGFNKECAGAGDLFKDVARHQIRSGIERLAEESSNDNATTIKFMAQNYLKNLPSECAFLNDLDEFEKVLESKNETDSSTVASATTVAEAESVDSKQTTEPAAVQETTAAPETEPEEPKETGTTSARQEEETSTMGEPERVEGFIKASNDEIASEMATSTLKAEEEAEHEPLEIAVTTVTAVETTAETQPVETKEEEKTEIGMDVNSLDQTTLAPTEPVIVVDDASESPSENDIQAGAQEEVKSASAGLLFFSSLFAIGAALLLA